MKITQFLSLVLCLGISLCSKAQADSGTEVPDSITFKDGVTMPKAEFMDECVKASKKEFDGAINANGYCSCMLDFLSENYTIAEMGVLFLGEGEKNLVKNLLSDSLLRTNAQICISHNIQLDSTKTDTSSDGEWSEEVKAGFIFGCQKEMEQNAEIAKAYSSKTYCDCMLTKLEAEYRVSDLLDKALLQSTEFQQMAVKCLMGAQK